MPTIIRSDTFSQWLANLGDANAEVRIARRIERLGAGNPGDHRNLTGGVSELRIDYGPGYRVYFTRRETEVVILLCGGDKSTQQADITAALAMAKEIER